ncbi:hypothetical protein ACFQU1_12240 [Chelatococcus sp. GCM10030263]|uniref:hypothetical protein n=1 Tax=Chelatococcus sp. GCM10030263 TaxID=3273387 RepID=UPI003619D563
MTKLPFVTAAITLFVLAGCVHPEAKRRIEQAQACKAKTFTSSSDRAECIIAAEAGLPMDSLRVRRFAVLRALAQKVDAGEITQAEADREYENWLEDRRREERAKQMGRAAMFGAMAGVH